MKSIVLTVITVLFLTVATIAQLKQAASFKTPAVPKEFIGHWQKGVFSLSSFEQYDGKYIGPANETSVSYVIEEDGTAKEYFIANTNSYNCRLQVLGFRKGKIVINDADNSFEFQPVEGYYTSVSCFSKTPTKKQYTSKELYPDYVVKGVFKKWENDSIVLITKRSDGSEGVTLRKLK